MQHVVLAIVILILLLLIFGIFIQVAYATSSAKIPNKACKLLAQNFDPAILSIVGLRPASFLCDVLMPG